MTTTHRTATGAGTAVQKTALAVAAVFLLVGVFGFVPGITAEHNQLHVVGAHSEAMLLGLFQVSVLHNVVHVLFEVAGLALAPTVSGARSDLLFGGIVYLVLFLYGLVIDQDSAANFVPLNAAGVGLYLLLGAGMVTLALVLTRTRNTRHI